METYIFVKKASKEGKNDGKHGYMAIFKPIDGGKSVAMTGNFPGLYPSMTIKIEFANHLVMGYEIPDSDRNRKILAKQGVNSTEYFTDIKLHQKTGVLWTDIKKIKAPYDYFDWETAEVYGKMAGYDMRDSRRINALVKEVREVMRGCRKESYEISQYVSVFTKVEDRGKFPHLPLEEVIETLESSLFSVSRNGLVVDMELDRAHKYNRSEIVRRMEDTKELLPYDEIEKKLKETDSKYSHLTDEQKMAVLSLAETAPTVITGGAGTGKTSTIKGILDMLDEFGLSKSYLLLAPTGRASQRMRETTGRDAYTIHHAVGIAEDSDYRMRNENNPLEFSVIIVDEGSMIDDLLMCDLLKATPETAKLYFVGDRNQLYPVGCGEPFVDFLKDGLCNSVTLCRNFRQDKQKGIGIARNADRLLEGKDFVEDTGLAIKHIKKADVFKVIDRSGNVNVQNISPFNALNDEINESVMETKDKINNTKYALFEKVVAIKNTKEYNNGDIGHIRGINADGSLLIQFYQRDVCVPVDEYCNIKPAYSLTVHKCQGSEFQKVNLFVPENRSNFINTRMLYTAVTRAKESLTIYLYS